jgi:hypothetical protein
MIVTLQSGQIESHSNGTRPTSSFVTGWDSNQKCRQLIARGNDLSHPGQQSLAEVAAGRKFNEVLGVELPQLEQDHRQRAAKP